MAVNPHNTCVFLRALAEPPPCISYRLAPSTILYSLYLSIFSAGFAAGSGSLSRFELNLKKSRFELMRKTIKKINCNSCKMNLCVLNVPNMIIDYPKHSIVMHLGGRQ